MVYDTHIESLQELLFPGLINPFYRLINKGRCSLDKRRQCPHNIGGQGRIYCTGR